jgi:hypothetical protein
MSTVRWLLCVGAVVLGVCGCSAQKRDRSSLATRILTNGDTLYRSRAEIWELDKAIQWYLSGVREFPENAKLMGRLARAYTVRAYAHLPDGLDGFATAREFGLRCLMTEPAFGGLVQSAGGAVTVRAVETLESDRIGCMTWTSLAWSRWLADRGVIGAAIDLEATIALASRAVDVKGDYDKGRPHAALGLALALAPEPLNPDLERARRALNKATSIAPSRLTPIVDLAQYVSAVEGKDGEWNALLRRVVDETVAEDDPDRLENLAAIQRAQALLAAGPDTRWND